VHVCVDDTSRLAYVEVLPDETASRSGSNGKAERFIQTMLREWCYAATYQSSDHRADALPSWLDYYNNHRPHSALGHKTPARSSTLTNAPGIYR
jgi:transposase InsO family protein